MARLSRSKAVANGSKFTTTKKKIRRERWSYIKGVPTRSILYSHQHLTLTLSYSQNKTQVSCLSTEEYYIKTSRKSFTWEKKRGKRKKSAHFVVIQYVFTQVNLGHITDANVYIAKVSQLKKAIQCIQTCHSY